MFAVRTRSFWFERLLDPVTLKKFGKVNAAVEIEFLNKKRVGT
jgi:hypothetical protein